MMTTAPQTAWSGHKGGPCQPQTSLSPVRAWRVVLVVREMSVLRPECCHVERGTSVLRPESCHIVILTGELELSRL